MKPRTPLALMGSWLALALTPIGSLAATATGTLTGDISSAATGNLPVGAQVDAPALGRRVSRSRCHEFRAVQFTSCPCFKPAR